MEYAEDKESALPREQLQEAIPVAMDEVELLSLSMSASDTTVESANDSNNSSQRTTTEQQTFPLDTLSKPSIPPVRDRVALPARPLLKRDKSTPLPAPQHLPPPAPSAPPSDATTSIDSGALMQLRRSANDVPKLDPTPYAFEYQDASSFPDELEEWFTYAVEEQAMILKTKTSFVQTWSEFNGQTLSEIDYEEGKLNWLDSNDASREGFVARLLKNLKQDDEPKKLQSLEALTYIVLGCWYETAGHTKPSPDQEEAESELSDHGNYDVKTKFKTSAIQIEWIKNNIGCLVQEDGFQSLFDVMRAICHTTCNTDPTVQEALPQQQESDRLKLFCSMTAVYVCIEIARSGMDEDLSMSIRLCALKLEPELLPTLMDLVSRIRWEEQIPLPLAKVLLLLWKSFLVCFGGMEEIKKVKASFQDTSLEESDKHGQPLITASPLDYHLFRQEISSKYPAYSPPPPLFPLEPENNSILPPLINPLNKAGNSSMYGSGFTGLNGSNTSILHQPVHIATPAPSPPPSPAGPGGKGGKKQNYQTNQLFPFLYPPLDESSNKLGGKGSTDLQDVLVGRKWKGSDIPASILEAAQLFAKRMRATRAMKQLWDVRVQFMTYERGWAGPDEDVDVFRLDTSAKVMAPEEANSDDHSNINTETSTTKTHHDFGTVEERLNLVESFYSRSLPQLQSLVIVLIRVILNHVTAIVTQANGPNGLQSGFQYQESQNGTAASKGEPNGAIPGSQADLNSSLEELEAVRSQEILDKALSGILILLLKWFKVSHILKFEYMTQLLVDSSYIPLVLKLLQLQEIERVVAYRCDREELNFFQFCRAHSRKGMQEPQSSSSANASDKGQSSDEDDAAPPPIKRHREPSPSSAKPDSNSIPFHPPEVDELGIPTSDLPLEPITAFSWRAFFTSINYLRILQKICKGKAHRNLMLVSYKSSQVLRKCLRVPQPSLRLYTLKLFKNQVPYCGRKWRQTNMRVITAVYLHCRPELRDEWLSGSDVDAEVDESVPLEQALRALTHWWNLKWYPEAMGAQQGVLEEERDFFRKELEKMSWGENGDDGDGQGIAGSDWDASAEGW